MSTFLGLIIWSYKVHKINKRAIENGGKGLKIISGMTNMVMRNHRFGKKVAERYNEISFIFYKLIKLYH
jgi:hypothetical protein